jgi:hypothetical protein
VDVKERLRQIWASWVQAFKRIKSNQHEKEEREGNQVKSSQIYSKISQFKSSQIQSTLQNQNQNQFYFRVDVKTLKQLWAKTKQIKSNQLEGGERGQAMRKTTHCSKLGETHGNMSFAPKNVPKVLVWNPWKVLEDKDLNPKP